MTPLGFFFGIAGTSYALLAMICSLPWLFGRASTTGWLGRRYAGHLGTAQNWTAMGRFMGVQVWIWSLPTLISGIIAFVIPVEKHLWIPAVISLTPLFLLWAAFLSYRYARRLVEANAGDGS